MSDPYFDLPPMPNSPPSGGAAPATSPPAAVPDATETINDDVDDGSLDLSAPDPDGNEDEDEAEPTSGGEDAVADDEDGPPEDDREWLIERATKADEYERLLHQQHSQRKEAEAVAYWDDRLNKANAAFKAKEDVIYQNAETNLNPIGYLKQAIGDLNNEATSWYAQYRDNREQALWQFAHQQAIPNHAARVVEHYKLPKEAVDELLDYPPEQMEREAQKMRARLIRERKSQRTIDQLRRKEAARKIAANTVAPGSGRAAGGKALSEMTDEERYFSIPWGRG